MHKTIFRFLSAAALLLMPSASATDTMLKFVPIGGRFYAFRDQ